MKYLSKDGLVTIRIIEAMVTTILDDGTLSKLIKDEQGKPLSKEELRTKCFDVKLDVQLTRELLSRYPVIQVFKWNSQPNLSSRFIRDMMMAVQVNSKDGTTALTYGEVIEDILEDKTLYINKDYKCIMKPIAYVTGKSTPSNVIGVHCYQTIYEANALKI